ncbi:MULTISPECIES: MarR family winged helix-turn-helix transcriptional regulator [unclassified Curtobacterium]|jgi:DNA-binding MarR family transcriptional regulator|uniref:MarR family winged helix-turn-helix transcriptional regulator n=1 Tax=unclassified Curtobacterium TaxID=257496 RepID=UPI001AE65662|nr:MULTISPECIES: helix-turn-helix domain-containing protein [unclassified Curtobacterium]MBP1299988.1 DNA-binding MarR family transcriptional regulator [Curtobacterium sp. 1310]MCM3520377.1 MarR family transcriptional regulator [Curtobacterium sp. P97]MDB6428706.1 helix-turn-helix domain-containing protein [Curtobacterium sp. 20TX0008]MDT0209813.1 helix-turn-helix domain-containing protein [Curtobacterium sp. BRD11]
MPDIDPLTTDWQDDEVAVMHHLRDWAVAFEELDRHLGVWMGMSTTDANALGQVLWAEQAGEPLSPAQLARQIGMTSGATSVLVDRLETAGHVTRHRESTDRRRVTLRATAAARAANEAFLALAGREIAGALRESDPTELRAALRFLARMTTAATAANTRLAARRSGGSTTATAH